MIGSAQDIVLLWSYTKFMVALVCLMPRTGPKWLLKDIVLAECLWGMATGVHCLCWFMERLVVIAGLYILQSIKRKHKMHKH